MYQLAYSAAALMLVTNGGDGARDVISRSVPPCEIGDKVQVTYEDRDSLLLSNDDLIVTDDGVLNLSLPRDCTLELVSAHIYAEPTVYFVQGKLKLGVPVKTARSIALEPFEANGSSATGEQTFLFGDKDRIHLSPDRFIDRIEQGGCYNLRLTANEVTTSLPVSGCIPAGVTAMSGVHGRTISAGVFYHPDENRTIIHFVRYAS